MLKAVVVLNWIVLGLLLFYVPGTVLLKVAQNSLFQQVEITALRKEAVL